MNEVLKRFLEEEITGAVYEELWAFVKSSSVIRGTFECKNHVIMKLSSSTFIIYPQFMFGDNIKCHDAVIVGKNFFLKKINSIAYQKRLSNIQNVFD